MRFARYVRRTPRINLIIILGLVVLLLLLATIFVVRSGANGGLRYVLGIFLILDFIAILSFAALLMIEIVRLVGLGSLGGSLQRRLLFFFVLMAIIPSLSIAIFSALSINFGLDGWFSSQVRDAVDSSYETALAYRDEHINLLERDGQVVYSELITRSSADRNFSGVYIRSILEEALTKTVNISHAFIIDGNAEIVARGDGSYKFNYIPPKAIELARAFQGEVIVIEDGSNNQFRYLRSIEEVGQNRFLILSRPVDGQILSLLHQTEETARFYVNLDRSRLNFMLIYAALFLVVVLLIMLVSISVALYLSSRLTRPINQLVKAVTRMKEGELSVRVPVSSEYEEFAVLSSSFNNMSAEVQEQQDAIRKAGEDSERERQRFNSVLEGVSSGVVGLDSKNRVTFINRAAKDVFGHDLNYDHASIAKFASEFMPLIEEARKSGQLTQSQLLMVRNGIQETIFVRVSPQTKSKTLIINFDDVSNLVQAQRMAAWGDVARRIAHEIKNPLTPIRLSAERMQRRYGSEISDEKFSDLTQIIIRQTEDLRRIVDEFSKFSKMPDPVMVKGNLVQILREVITLREQDTRVKMTLEGSNELLAMFDRAMMAQAFGNLVKNAEESTSEVRANEEFLPEIKIITRKEKTPTGEYAIIEIIDNGIGLPENRAKLFEPYVTLKDTGTGLGLSIVKKIIEDHGGSLNLTDRADKRLGAVAIIRIPLLTKEERAEIHG